MVKKIMRGFVFFILLMMIIAPVSASFTKGNLSYSIEKFYESGGQIKGWINISLENEPSTSILESSFGDSISLKDLIKNSIYTCVPATCKSDYSINTGETSKIFELKKNQYDLFGLNITSNQASFSKVNGFIFSLIGNNTETINLPLSIDILNDGQEEWQAYKSSENFNQKNFGCFIVPEEKVSWSENTPYCERINLSENPGVSIGAYVFANTGGNVDFNMSIERIDGKPKGNCTATASGTGTISCIPSDFSIKKEEAGDYFVCIKPKFNADKEKYKIQYETKNPCGFSGKFSKLYTKDFEIFAQQKKYAPSTSFTLNDEELTNSKSWSSIDKIKTNISSYISKRYNNKCENGCIIPIRIYSGSNQEVEITDMTLDYTTDIPEKTEYIYNIAETPAKINARFQKFSLDDAKFYAPIESGEYTLSVKLGGKDIFSEKISIKEISTEGTLTPLKTAVKYPTKFKLDIDFNENISKYKWDFGDESPVQTTDTNQITYIYNIAGEYKLKIELVDKDGTSRLEEFDITVGLASEMVPTLLDEIKINLANVQNQMTDFSEFEQNSINQALNLDTAENEIVQLEEEISTAVTEENYGAILEKLVKIKIPISVSRIITSEDVLFYPEEENIDLEILKKIGGGDYSGKEEEYKESILAWNEENVEAGIIYDKILFSYDNYEEFLNIFDVSVTKGGEDNAYLILKKSENLEFQEDYSEKEEGEYFYIELTESEKNVIFSTTADVDFITVPMFISPQISKLTIAEWSPFEEDGGLKKWIFFTIIVVGIFIVGIIVWIILQLWYKRKYENYLFKNRNNLYNLINYVEIEKKNGANEKEIISKLKKTGWTSEQLSYVLKKYAGKRTGMIEIPIDKIINKIFGKNKISSNKGNFSK